MNYQRAFIALFLTSVSFFSMFARTGAIGTVRVQQAGGAVHVYQDVSYRLVRQALRVMSKSGEATLIIDHANCAYQGYVEHCVPYGVKLSREASTQPLPVKSGDIYVNPTNQKHQLPHSSTQIPPRGILGTIVTKTGAYISLSGTIDQFEPVPL